ncbi:GntR family transcriptional regulator [Sulfitobacter sp. LCG007]
MTEKQAEFEPEIERIVAAIDQGSSVPASIQLRGALEFGIASGDLPDGQRLPSVRAMAKRVGISPVTVSNVYAALQTAGHIEGRAGSGTYVRASIGTDQRRRLAEVDARIAELIALGRDCGLTLTDLALRVTMAQPAAERPVSVLMVGNFHDATEAYAADIRAYLRDSDRIEPVTLQDLERTGADGHDLIVAPRTLLPQIRELFPKIDAVGVTLIPNESTRVALASLDPDVRVAGYSYFPGFVTIMKTGIQRFAPHVADLTMVVRGDTDEADRISGAEVVIYASGADYLRQQLRPGQAAFEYRHTPDAQSIRSELLPAIETCRRQTPTRKDAAE